MPWEGNPRTTTPQWRATRLRILERDHWTCQHPGCGQHATQVDHIINDAAGGTDDDSNLQALCTPHHRTKSANEGAAARWRTRATRTPDPHPGLR